VAAGFQAPVPLRLAAGITLSFAYTQREALHQVADSACEILVTTIHLNGKRNSGLELLTCARSLHQDIRGIVVGDSGDRVEVTTAFRAGARGFLCNAESTAEKLLKVIRCVHDGQVWASSLHLNFVLDEFSTPRKSALPIPPHNGLLSTREWEVAQLIIRGKSNKEIAAALEVSQHTVKNHLVKIFVKLGVTSRSGAVFRIYQQSMIRPATLHNEEPNELRQVFGHAG
jgi:DNA-binding NarL/FixJ family response regulator